MQSHPIGLGAAFNHRPLLLPELRCSVPNFLLILTLLCWGWTLNLNRVCLTVTRFLFESAYGPQTCPVFLMCVLCDCVYGWWGGCLTCCHPGLPALLPLQSNLFLLLSGMLGGCQTAMDDSCTGFIYWTLSVGAKKFTSRWKTHHKHETNVHRALLQCKLLC